MVLREPGYNSEIPCHMKYATLISSTWGQILGVAAEAIVSRPPKNRNMFHRFY
jgi:hypothetical protein